jgi:hypothetical protein
MGNKTSNSRVLFNKFVLDDILGVFNLKLQLINYLTANTFQDLRVVFTKFDLRGKLS